MPDFTDLVMQIRNSGLPEREKAELEKRLIREGPSMDVDRAIEAAFNPPTSTPSQAHPNRTSAKSHLCRKKITSGESRIWVDNAHYFWIDFLLRFPTP